MENVPRSNYGDIIYYELQKPTNELWPSKLRKTITWCGNLKDFLLI